MVNHVLIGWGFEGAEEACRKEGHGWLKATRGEMVVSFLLGKSALKCLKRECGDDSGSWCGRGQSW